MQRIIKLVGSLFLLVCCLQFIVFLFIKQHDVSYTIKTGKDTYQIKEHFEIIAKNNVYTFEVKNNKKRTYHFQTIKNYHKQDKIIKTIESYHKENLFCIYPVYLKEKPGEIICQENKEEYVVSYLLSKEDERVEDFITQLKKKGYKNNSWQSSTKNQKTKKVTYYQENILEDEALYFWNYQGVLIGQKNQKLRTENLLKTDQYENNKSILVEDKLLMIDSDQEYDFNHLYIISLFSNQIEEINLKDKIAQDSYFQGSVGSLAYLIDRKNLKQYEINIKKKTVKLVGNKESNAKYYDGKKWKIRNIYDFIKNDIYFGEDISSKVKKKYSKGTLLKGIGRTYLVKDNTVYYISDMYLENPIALFTLDDLKEVTVKENSVLLISKDTLYQYDEQQGLRSLLTSRELLFNYKNMYGVAFKK